jgi:hypothetical protein
MGQERRRDIAKFEGSRVRASMMFQACFLAVEKKERMSAKSMAPAGDSEVGRACGRIPVADELNDL